MFTISSKLIRKLGPALLLAGAMLGLLVTGPELAAQRTFGAGQQISITGIPVPGMESFDRFMTNLMAMYDIPGAAVAVVKDGRLVFAHGYGLADKENNQLVQPESLFRIASISKPITAVTVLKLVEEGKLDLDAKVFCAPGGSCLLEHLQPPPGRTVLDQRIYNITVRMLLQHSGGWDRSRSGDPMFRPITTRAAQAVGVPEPPSCDVIIRYMLGQWLDFEPGTGYAYSNFGYCVLGRVIEKVTGQGYEDYVKENVLKPMGIKRMRIGRTKLEERAEGEVRYYDYQNRVVQSVFPGQGLVPAPYGAWYHEALDAHGGWIASAIDLLRFVTAVDGRRPPAFLKPETVRLMISRPELPYWQGSSFWYGMGWLVRPVRGDANWWHDGALTWSTFALLVRTYHGLSWAALFNTWPSQAFGNEVDRVLWQAAGEVTEWPTHDLFEQYP
jgi:CubicO group peptidase (beta-lactamase class C family)